MIELVDELILLYNTFKVLW